MFLPLEIYVKKFEYRPKKKYLRRIRAIQKITARRIRAARFSTHLSHLIKTTIAGMPQNMWEYVLSNHDYDVCRLYN